METFQVKTDHMLFPELLLSFSLWCSKRGKLFSLHVLSYDWSAVTDAEIYKSVFNVALSVNIGTGLRDGWPGFDSR